MNTDGIYSKQDCPEQFIGQTCTDDLPGDIFSADMSDAVQVSASEFDITNFGGSGVDVNVQVAPGTFTGIGTAEVQVVVPQNTPNTITITFSQSVFMRRAEVFEMDLSALDAVESFSEQPIAVSSPFTFFASPPAAEVRSTEQDGRGNIFWDYTELTTLTFDFDTGAFPNSTIGLSSLQFLLAGNSRVAVLVDCDGNTIYRSLLTGEIVDGNTTNFVDCDCCGPQLIEARVLELQDANVWAIPENTTSVTFMGRTIPGNAAQILASNNQNASLFQGDSLTWSTDVGTFNAGDLQLTMLAGDTVVILYNVAA